MENSFGVVVGAHAARKIRCRNRLLYELACNRYCAVSLVAVFVLQHCFEPCAHTEYLISAAPSKATFCPVILQVFTSTLQCATPAILFWTTVVSRNSSNFQDQAQQNHLHTCSSDSLLRRRHHCVILIMHVMAC